MREFNVDKLVTSIINYFRKNLEVDEEKEAILRFSIHLVISAVFSSGLVLLVALLLGNFVNVLFILLTISILRSFSGGAHSSSMVSCGIYGAIIMNILGLIIKYSHPSKVLLSIIVFFTFMFSMWSINKYAPADTPGKPITTKVKRNKLRKLSFLTLYIWCILCLLWYTGFINNHILVYTTTLGILWQSFTLTDLGYALFHYMDRAFQRINKKEGEIL